jgi:hypothetical protein
MPIHWHARSVAPLGTSFLDTSINSYGHIVWQLKPILIGKLLDDLMNDPHISPLVWEEESADKVLTSLTWTTPLRTPKKRTRL